MMLIGNRLNRQKLIWLILLDIFLWLTLIAMQAIFGPFDGYMPIHVRAPGALISSGPIIAKTLLYFARPLLSPMTVWLSYSLLLIAAPIFSIWLIASIFGREGTSDMRAMHKFCIAAVVFLAFLTIFNLPYLSNDIYLYRVQGQMISRLGYSPYTSTPSDCFSKEVLQNIPWVNQNSPYGPLALVFFVAATSLNGGIVLDFWLLKVILSLPWLIMLIYIYSSRLFAKERKVVWLAWIGLNPLLVLENQGNDDYW